MRWSLRQVGMYALLASGVVLALWLLGAPYAATFAFGVAVGTIAEHTRPQ